jgi:RHS repeat-associated protein
LTGFTVTASPGGRTVEVAPGTTSAVVDGLEPGTPYTFTVTASNKHGAGPASAPTLPVVPVPVPQDPVSAFQLTLDELGNPARVVTTRNGVSESVAYGYDEVDRVVSACYGAVTCAGASAGRIDYRYDLVGNRTKQTLSGSAGTGVTEYSYDDADQLTRQTTQTSGRSTTVDYGYDLDGNQVRAGNDRFEYNLDHSVAKATVSGRSTTFGYDAAGLRVSATTGTGDQATTQRFTWDVNGTLPQIAVDTVTAASGQTLDKRGFAYGPDDEPLALLDPATGAHSYTHDWLGGVANMVSPAGVPEQGYDYDPFGNPRMGETLAAQPAAGTQAATGPANPLRYAGAYQDNTTGNGNYYLRARNYNPGTGRFTTTDPMPRGGAATSSYVYADNNPLAYADPTGLRPEAADGGGAPAPPTTGEQPQGPSPEEIARANQIQNKSLLDVVLEAGGQILMEILGINDIIDCLKGDIGACVMTVIGALPWGKIFKAKKIAEALWRAGKAVFKFFEEIKWARAILRGAEEAAEAAKAAAAAAAKAAAEKAAAVKAAAERAARQAAEEAAARARALAAKAKAKTKKGSGNSGDAPGSGDSCPVPLPHSFVAGTRVQLADGSTRPIEQTQPGDTVLATDPITGKTEPRQVTHGIRTDSDKSFVDVTVDDPGTGKPDTVTTTEHHPFWSVTDGRWVDAGDLKPGSLLRTSAGTYVQVTAVHRYPANRVTYDLTVDGSHTYYVLAGDSPVLVHNCGGSRTTNGRPHSQNCTCAAGGPERVPNNPWGGRGKPSTQNQNVALQEQISEANPDWRHVAGGTRPEQNVVGPNGEVRRPDLIFEHPASRTRIYIQTVTTYANGAAIPEELSAALDIARWGNGIVIMYPKL